MSCHKKEVRPAQEVEFMGFAWNRERRLEYRRAVKNLLRHGQTRATWRRVVGKLAFLREAVGPTMGHVRSLLHVVAGHAEREGGLSLETVPVTGSIFTDASDGGLGYLIRLGGSDPAQDGAQTRFDESRSAASPGAHINRKETEAVLRALEDHREEPRGRRAVWYSDSTTALAAIRRQGTRELSKGAWETTKQVLDLAEREEICLVPLHVPGRLNGAADALSRPGDEGSAWERALER